MTPPELPETPETPETCQLRMLSSGSSGNAIFVRMGETRLLIDAGISRRRIAEALSEMGEDINNLNAVVITHEHSDHISGLHMLCKTNPELAVYTTRGTANAWKRKRKWELPCEFITSGSAFNIGDARLMPFTTSHDVQESVGLRLEYKGFAVGIATDLGRQSSMVSRALEGCQALVLEANHDLEMLWNGPYPLHLKHRVVSSKGHLSNEQMRDLLGELAGPHLQQVILAHLSEQNNSPQAALQALGTSLARAPRARVLVAERKDPSPLMNFEIPPPGAGAEVLESLPSPHDYELPSWVQY